MAPRDTPAIPRLIVQDDERFLEFREPVAVLEARTPDGVLTVLREADAALAAGSFVAGFLAYEAAAAFGLPVRAPDPDGPPLVWFGVFGEPREGELPAPLEELEGRGRGLARDFRAPTHGVTLTPSIDREGYAAVVARLQERIAAGDSYQLNFCFPLSGGLDEDPFALFLRLAAVQRARHAAFVDLGRFAFASASPELFFRRRSGRLETRPMKGTAARGPTRERDERAAAELVASEKQRAENLMIVDMLRNDLGRVAELGSVEVVRLFELERYPTLWQMTSTVTARSRAPLAELLAALFPCASVTGAPKRRTMQILAEHELGPRGLYTGTIGWAAPSGDACFSVAIRTAVADRERATLRYGVGSGIVADSQAEDEYAECLLKARVLGEAPFALVETLAFWPDRGLCHVERHLQRLAASADYFGFRCDRAAIERTLAEAVARTTGARRVRLELHGDGRVEVELSALPAAGGGPVRVGLAARAVDSSSPWLYHKTTRREVYDQARASRPDCDEVLLWNESGELTEGTIANLVVEREGRRVTPPVGCGLLAGIERQRLLESGSLREEVVRTDELGRGSRVWLVSSLRGEREAVFVG